MMFSFNLVHPEVAQYRTSDQIVTFLQPSPRQFVAHVHNLLNNSGKSNLPVLGPNLFFKAISKEPISSKKQLRSLLRHNYHPIFNNKTLVLSPDSTSETPFLTLFIDHAISLLQARIFSQLESTSTFERFKEPGVTSCNRTFEKTAVENVIRGKREKCPVPMPPILEDKHCIENLSEVEMYHQLAQNYLENQELEKALQAYISALKHTPQITAYEPIPKLYLQKKEPLHAALANLYLAKFQLQEQPKEVSKTLSEAIKLQTFPELQELKAIDYFLNHQNEEASSLLLALADEHMKQKKPQEAFCLYEQALICSSFDQAETIFRRLITLYRDPLKRENGYIRAILYFRSSLLSRVFYKEAQKRFPESPFVILAFLSTFRSHHGSRYELYRSLVDLYKKTGQISKCIAILQKLIPFQQGQDLEELMEFLKNRPRKLSQLFNTWIDVSLKQKDFSRAEQITQTALTKFPRDPSFLQHHYSITKNLNDPQKQIQATLQFGQFHENQNHLSRAEKLYKEAFQIQKTYLTTHRLAELHSKRGRLQESIRLYFEASADFFHRGELDIVALFYQHAIKLDPHLTSLSPTEKIAFQLQQFKSQVDL